MAHSSPVRCRRSIRPWTWLILILGSGVGTVAVPADTGRSGAAAAGASDAAAGLLLTEYFRAFLNDQDFDTFRNHVDARFSEAALCRLLTDSPAATTRRAAVVALGTLGNFPRSNPVLGHALRDPDPVVRRLAEDALWSLWFRADTPENNRALRDVVQLTARGELDEAERQVTRLIAVAPGFAEAYNQRAIIAFHKGRFAESARDCRSVLERNPYHFGALSGMAQCQLGLNRPGEALDALRRVSRLQPYNTGVRDNIRLIEAQLERADSR